MSKNLILFCLLAFLTVSCKPKNHKYREALIGDWYPVPGTASKNPPSKVFQEISFLDDGEVYFVSISSWLETEYQYRWSMTDNVFRIHESKDIKRAGTIRETDDGFEIQFDNSPVIYRKKD